MALHSHLIKLYASKLCSLKTAVMLSLAACILFACAVACDLEDADWEAACLFSPQTGYIYTRWFSLQPTTSALNTSGAAAPGQKTAEGQCIAPQASRSALYHVPLPGAHAGDDLLQIPRVCLIHPYHPAMMVDPVPLVLSRPITAAEQQSKTAYLVFQRVIPCSGGSGQQLLRPHHLLHQETAQTPFSADITGYSVNGDGIVTAYAPQTVTGKTHTHQSSGHGAGHLLASPANLACFDLTNAFDFALVKINAQQFISYNLLYHNVFNHFLSTTAGPQDILSFFGDFMAPLNYDENLAAHNNEIIELFY